MDEDSYTSDSGREHTGSERNLERSAIYNERRFVDDVSDPIILDDLWKYSQPEARATLAVVGDLIRDNPAPLIMPG